MSKLPQSKFDCKFPQSSLLGIVGHIQALTLQEKEGGSFLFHQNYFQFNKELRAGRKVVCLPIT